MVALAWYPNSKLGSGAGLRQTAKTRLPPQNKVLQFVWHADIAHDENVFWHSAIHVSVDLSSSGFPGRKMDATIGFGLRVMHKMVLRPARVIRQLENRAHLHSRGLSPSTGWTQSVILLHVIAAVGMYGGIKQVRSSPCPLGRLQI